MLARLLGLAKGIIVDTNGAPRLDCSGGANFLEKSGCLIF